MKQARFSMPLTQEQWQERQAMLDQLKKEPQVVRFLEMYKLDSSFLDKNASYFQNWIIHLRKCAGCQGLEYCRQPIKGKVCTIDLDEFGYLFEKYVSCKFEQKEEKKMVHERNYRICHGTKEDLMIDFSEIKLENEPQEYIDVYTAVAQSFEGRKGMYIYGQPGSGKSYLMWAVANHFAKKNKKVSYVKVPFFVQDLKQSFNDSEYIQLILSHLRFSEVLILDDIGSESISQWERDEILFPVLDYRMNHGLKTYFASNYTMEELELQYRLMKQPNAQVASLRLLERIRTLSLPLALLGKSRR